MRNFLKITAGLLSFICLLIIFAKTARADATISSNPPIDKITENTPAVSLTYSNLEPNQEYFINIFEGTSSRRFTTGSSGQYSVVVCGNGSSFKGKEIKYDNCTNNDFFAAKTYTFKLTKPNSRGKSLLTTKMIVPHYIPESVNINPQKPTSTDTITIEICGSRRPFARADRNTIDFKFSGSNQPPDPADLVIPGGCATRSLGTMNEGEHKLNLEYKGEDYTLWQFLINVDDNGNGSITAFKDPKKTSGAPGGNPCTVGPGGRCLTGLGDISTNPQEFASKILSIAVGLAGGIALILMVFGSIRVLTSSGDQQKLSGGRDQIVAAVAGLLFLIFSVLILRFIGIQILGL